MTANFAGSLDGSYFYRLAAAAALRGITVYRTSVEKAKRLAQQDPSVQARRLAAEVCTWYVQPGAFGDRPAPTVETG